jgi:hypothetical protein
MTTSAAEKDPYPWIHSEIIRIMEVDPISGSDLDDGYYGVAAWSRDAGLVRATVSLSDLADLVGDLTSKLDRFNLVLRDYPLGDLDGCRFDNDTLDEWEASYNPVADPKPFVPEPRYPTASEVVRIETVDPQTGQTEKTQFGVVVRGPVCGSIVARWADTLEDLHERVSPLTSHEARWKAVATCQSIGTVQGEFQDPMQWMLGQMFG